MNFIDRNIAIGGLLAILLPFAAAHAQLGDLLKSAETNTNSSSSALGGLGNLIPGQAPSTTNINNVTGILQYCIQNNYLGGNSAASIENSLKDKISNKSSSTNSSYTDGLKGILHSNDGKQVDLGGSSGLKAAATKQICDTVLSTAKSMM